ncbi:MAG: aminopeptidase [Bacteroidetes bacterium SW_9_63_38]|nr:MAG: aminopeptidase [Bacteroidetes bacterium SW_9_63_38]
MAAGMGCQEGSGQAVQAQDSGGPLPEEQAAYDVTHYDLNVRVDPAAQSLHGTLTVQATATDTLDVLVLNLDRRLSVETVWKKQRSKTRPVKRRGDGNQLWISLAERALPGETIRATVAYGGTPREAPDPPWEGGFTWAQTPNGDPWIATSGQTAGADLWWPVKDHPSDEPDSMDIAITVPDTLVAASNGVLRTVHRASDSTRTFEWHVSTSINSYAVTLNAAPYVRVDTTYASTVGVDVPVTFYALPSDTSRARATLPHFLDHVRFLEETLGPYPFRADKYGIAQTPFLGMEHQTLIAYGSTFQRNGGLGYNADFDALHFHELAHEWYGNCLTVRDWKDFWIHEGVATYLEALYMESLKGTAAYHDLISYFRRQVTNRTPIARKRPTPAQEMYGRDIYYKGALVLHTLRSMIGREALVGLLRDFVYPDGTDPAQACRHVETGDFLRRAEAVAGRSLDGVAETYLYRAALPYLDSTRTEQALTLRWRKAASGFAAPVPVRVGDTMRTVPMEGGKGTLSLPADATVEIDPENWLLRAPTGGPRTPQEKRRRRSRGR